MWSCVMQRNDISYSSSDRSKQLIIRSLPDLLLICFPSLQFFLLLAPCCIGR